MFKGSLAALFFGVNVKPRHYQAAAHIPPQFDWTMDLPVLAVREQLQAAIAEHPVIIVAGETGSGKTTQLPKICLAAGRGRAGCIAHTQPRRLAARAVSARIAEELGVALGSGVGYKVRFSDQTSDTTFLKVLTDGMLLAELGHDPMLRAYDTVIIDEAHERSLNIDFLLGYLKTLLPKRPDLRVIITSATIDVERFSAHFADAPIFVVEGRSYPVEVLYQPIIELAEADDAYDMIEEGLPRAVIAAVETCLAYERQQRRTSPGDMLIFASSEREIRDMAEALRRFGPPHCEVLPLYSRLSVQEQQRVFQPGKGRRIVIATNVAETSITVPNIHYVIDPGFARISRYSYRSKVQRLPIEPISQASANQRAGRCGRVAPGLCIRLYSEADFLGRAEFTDPEIRRTNLAAVILQMHVLRLGTLDAFPFIDAPDSRLVNDGYRLLDELGALTPDRKLTALGKHMARMPIDPRLARMLLAAAPLGALHDVLVVVSALAVQDPRERPPDKQQAADERHAQFRDPDSDFLFFRNLWDALAAQRGELTERQRREFARKHFLSWTRLREWRETYRQLALLCEQLKLNINQEPAPYDAIHRAMLSGLLSQVAQKGPEREYLAPRNQKALIFPGSVLAKKGAPWVMAAEMVETGRVYLRMVAKIQPEWVEHLAQHLLKRSYAEPHWRRKAGRVMAYEQTSLFGLVLQTKRLVNYELIDREVARELFIRDGLVANDIAIKAPFLQNNQQVVADVQRMEDKLRRRDLLVDEQALFNFYDARIPADIASQKSFENWRHRQEKQTPEVLFFSPEDVLATSDVEPEAEDFPESLSVAGHELPLTYHFEPGHENDGVCITVPAGLLDALPLQQFDWLVPGLLKAKVEALLRALPKSVRRQIVPLPDTVAWLMLHLPRDQALPLQSAITQTLRQKGLLISTADWQGVELEAHHHMQIRVLGANRQAIVTARDPEKLLQLLAKQPEAAVGAAPETRRMWERVGVARWDFGDLPEAIDTTLDGLPGLAYPALVRGEHGLAIKLLSQKGLAQRLHHEGTTELLRLQFSQEQKQLEQWLKKSAGLMLHASQWLPLASLATGILRGVIAESLSDAPRTPLGFEQAQQHVRPLLLPRCHALLPLLTDIFAKAQQVHQQLASLQQPVFQLAVADAQQQLAALGLATFVHDFPVARWQDYPRYLDGLLVRLQRVSHQVLKDDQANATVQRYWRQYLRLLEQRQASHSDVDELEALRWMIEELRISLFAQPMKTSMPVSEKRLDKLIEQLHARQ